MRREVDKEALQGRPPTMWRCFELLPVLNADKVFSLGEAGTLLLRVRNLGRRLG